MLRLALLRHAKAASAPPGMEDIDRPLHVQGDIGARLIHGWLLQHKMRFDLTLCSAAKRTAMTADITLAGLTGKRLDLKALYNCSIADICAALAVNAAKTQSVVVIGHNPTMGDMARWLVGSGDMAERAKLVGGYPPGSLMIADMDIGSWEEVTQGCGTLAHFVRPRDLDLHFRE